MLQVHAKTVEPDLRQTWPRHGAWCLRWLALPDQVHLRSGGATASRWMLQVAFS